MKKIFFATPIAGFGDEKLLLDYKKQIISLVKKLKIKFEVFAEIAIVRSINDYDTPAESAMIDFKEIEESELFVLHYPVRIPTSALIELGYAFGKSKKIIIIVPDRDVLPYLAQKLDNVYEKMRIILYDELNKETIRMLYQEICKAVCK